MKKRRENAFTLVEALATLVLLAIVLPVAMQGISLATQVSGVARERTESTSLAEAKMVELTATGDWQGSDLSGDFGEDWPQYKWEAEVTDWEEPSLRLLTVKVDWVRRGRQRSTELSTVLYAGSE